jgi:hypothetical protein
VGKHSTGQVRKKFWSPRYGRKAGMCHCTRGAKYEAAEKMTEANMKMNLLVQSRPKYLEESRKRAVGLCPRCLVRAVGIIKMV